MDIIKPPYANMHFNILTVYSQPLINIFSRRQSYSFPQVSTTQGSIDVFLKLSTLYLDKGWIAWTKKIVTLSTKVLEINHLNQGTEHQPYFQREHSF